MSEDGSPVIDSESVISPLAFSCGIVDEDSDIGDLFRDVQNGFSSDAIKEDSTIGAVYREVADDVGLEMIPDNYCELRHKYLFL